MSKFKKGDIVKLVEWLEIDESYGKGYTIRTNKGMVSTELRFKIEELMPTGNYLCVDVSDELNSFYYHPDMIELANE